MKSLYQTLVNKLIDWDYFNRILENDTNLSVLLDTIDQLEGGFNTVFPFKKLHGTV